MYTISPAFIAALKGPGHTIRVHMDVLDPNFNIVTQFRDTGAGTDATDILIDGNVDADTTRLTRRTFTANVLNPGGIWSPLSNNAGTFYVNRLVRFYRGIDFGGTEELVPVGTFLLDSPTVDVERGMSVVTLSGSDLWKKYGKSNFSQPYVWPIGTPLNTVIADTAVQSGITMTNLDPLSSRLTADTVLGKAFAVERGDNRGEAISKLCADFGVDIYFDTLGRLTTSDFQTPGSKAVVWTYDPEDNNNLITVKAAYTDDNLYNAVLVVGTLNKDNIVTYRVRDTDPTSPTSVDAIGERLLIFETETVGAVSLAEAVALRLFYQNVLVNEDITLETICNPAFEGNDVIRARESEFSQIDNDYRIKAFTVPLSTSRQTIRLLREIRLT
jgi:hypothetical protein